MRRGFTLIELVLVVMILGIIAGLVVPLLGGFSQISTPTGPKSDRQIVTETTMQTVRDAIMGTDARPGAWTDMGQRPADFPTNPNAVLYETFNGVSTFDPVTKIGWRGPYLSGMTQVVDAWGNAVVIQVDFDNNGTLTADEVRYARLVSGGENGTVDTPLLGGYIPGDNSPAATEISLAECGDDIVLFFRVSDTRQ